MKEFFKAQTMIAESIQEYYAENQLDELKQYVQINALSLNNIYKTNVILVYIFIYSTSDFTYINI